MAEPHPASTHRPEDECRPARVLCENVSLRRAARAAGTTHKVLLYHFDGVDDLLRQAILQLRERRIGNALAAIAREPAQQTLAARVRAVWPALAGEESRVLDQAIGLMMYDSARYAELGRGASQQYLPSLLSLIVWASGDRVMPPEHGQRLAKLLPHGQLVEVEDSYTLIPLDQPARLAQIIREFTRGLALRLVTIRACGLARRRQRRC